MPGERDFEQRNSDSRERLRTVAQGLSADALTRPIDEDWTAASLMAHVGFWDRYVLERWRFAVAAGTGTPSWLDDDFVEMINAAAIPEWNALPPRDAAEMCVASAEAIDGFIASLGDDVVADVIRQGRPRLLDRSLHRAGHLQVLERISHI
jgi:hypothetical protein